MIELLTVIVEESLQALLLAHEECLGLATHERNIIVHLRAIVLAASKFDVDVGSDLAAHQLLELSHVFLGHRALLPTEAGNSQVPPVLECTCATWKHARRV